MVRKTGIVQPVGAWRLCVFSALLGRREENVALNEMPAYRGTDVEGGRFSWGEAVVSEIFICSPTASSRKPVAPGLGGVICLLRGTWEPMSLEPEHPDCVSLFSHQILENMLR